MKRLSPFRMILSLALLALAGCAAVNPRFPSLLPRASESRDEAEPVAAQPTLVADPALDKNLATLNGTLAESATGFAELGAKAKAAVGAAKRSGTGSEPWLTAQTILADLDVQRAKSLTVLSELDRLAIDRGTAGLSAYPAIDALRTAAEAQVKAQGDEIDALQDQLPPA